MRTTTLGILLSLLAFCIACQTKRQTAAEGEPIKLAYASNLTIRKANGYTTVTIRNPWDTLKTLHTYVLVPKEAELPTPLPEGTLIRTPLQRAVVYSSVHCSLLLQIGALGSIAGICDLQYIKLPQIIDRCASGRITDVGNGMAPNVEMIIDLDADAILLSPFENSGGYGRVEKIGIPIVECADYMEVSPLARAEWMRFYGLLFGHSEEADSLFATVEKNYLELKALVDTVDERPSLISDMKSASIWYVPGGKSTLGMLYKDAGADYLWADDNHSGSVALAPETVLDKGQSADVWVIKYNQPTDKTLSELESDYAPYARFKSFRDGQVYGCNTGIVPFYEDTPFRPDRLLKDYIKLFHPQLLPDYQLQYFKKLEK